jgi:hypothetical protein
VIALTDQQARFKAPAASSSTANWISPHWTQATACTGCAGMRTARAYVTMDNAIDGDTTAARECFDRMDGKVAQGVDATGQVRGDITVTWVRPAY